MGDVCVLPNLTTTRCDLLMVSTEEGAVGEDAEMMPNTGDLTRMKYIPGPPMT